MRQKPCSASCEVFCFASDVESRRTRGSPGESGRSRLDHHEQTQSPQRPQPDHDQTDVPSVKGETRAPFLKNTRRFNN